MSMSKEHMKGTFSRKDRELSNDIHLKDVKPGDVYWVNYPYKETDDTGFSAEGKIRPAIIIGKHGDRVIVVKGTTSENPKYVDPNDIETVEGYRIDCSKISTLKEHDLLEYENHVDVKSSECKAMRDKALDRVKNHNYTNSRWEQKLFKNINYIEEASTDTNLLISEDDIYVNFNKWKSGKSKVLFIIGLSGSGKSTISKKMASKYHAIRTETDTIAFCIAGHKRAVVKGWANFKWLDENDPMVARYLREKNIDPLFLSDPRFDVSKAKPTRDKESEEIIQQEVDKYIHWLCYEQKQRVVVEGGHGAVCITRHPDMYKNFPCIIKGTSIAKSMFRRTVRDADEPKDLILRPYILIKQYAKMVPEMNAARGVLLDDNEWKYVRESMLQEGFIFSDEDLYQNFKEWEVGKNKILYILGLAGSGKSTLSEELGKKYNCLVIHRDEVHHMLSKGNKDWKNIPKEERYKLILDTIMKKANNSRKCIIDGGNKILLDLIDPKRDSIIIKGTSFITSEYRMIKRTLGNGPQGIKMIKGDNPVEFFLNLLHVIYVCTRNNVKTYKEFNNIKDSIEEGAIMTIKGKVPSCKDFKDFCSKIKTPGDALKWFIKNKVQWPKGDANKYPFHWPDDLVKEKIGNCFDQTVFMHYFCRKKRIDHRMFIISWVGDNGYSTGHAVPMYEKNGYVWIWLYLYPGYGMVGGPFRDYDEAKKTLDQYFLVSVNKALKSPTTPYSSFLDDADVSKFDDYYGNHDITQEDYIMMNHGYNLKSTHMFRFNVGGRSFYNPFGDLLRTIDVLKELYRLFKSQDKVEECHMDENNSLETIE